MLSSGNPTNDVWFSVDGGNFQLANNNAAFSPRSDHTSLAFINKLWVIGGWDGTNYLSDVWYTNGISPYSPTPTFTYTVTPTTTSTVTPTITSTGSPTPPSLNFTPVPTMSCQLANTWTAPNPTGLALDQSGNVYFADYDDSIMGFIGTNGIPVTWGGPGSANGQLSNPWGIAIGTDGLIYVTDSGNDRVEVFDGQGNYKRQWGSQGSGPGQFQIPAGIAVNGPASLVYVSSSYDDRIEYFDTQGNYQGEWGSSGIGGGLFNNPWGVALDASGQVYVADYGNDLVQVFNGQGGFVKQWTTEGGLAGAEYIAVDNANNVEYVTDALGEVGAFDQNGYPLGITQGPGGGFDDSEGVAVGPGGWYVADYGNGKIDQFNSCSFVPTPTFTSTFTPTYTPTFTTTFTPTVTPPIINCPLLSSWNINWGAYGIALNSNGYVYVGDQSDGQVDVYAPGGSASVTQFGNGYFPYNDIHGIAVDGNSFTYVTENVDSTVSVFDSNYNPVTQWLTSSNLWAADGIAVFPSSGSGQGASHVYVTDPTDGSVNVFTTTGAPITQLGIGIFNSPTGVAVDNLGNIYVADGSSVYVLNSQWNPVTQWSATEGTPLYNANFIGVDNERIVFVSDWYWGWPNLLLLVISLATNNSAYFQLVSRLETALGISLMNIKL